MKKINKVLIPCAGLGTRFLPATKSLPKEMFPIIDTPTLQYIVDEANKSGIDEIGIIISQAKPMIQSHFTVNEELEQRLRALNKNEEADLIHSIAKMAKITFINQPEPKGLGHAILCAEEFINGEDFAVMLGDDLIMNFDDETNPVMKQLVSAYEKYDASVLGVQEVPLEDVSKYGIVKVSKEDGRYLEMSGMIEKPKKEVTPSRYAVLGRYVLKNEIFDYLRKVTPNKNGEIGLTEGIDLLLRDEKVYAYNFIGTRYDIGNKFGYVKATIDFALRRDDLKDKVKEYLKKIGY